MYRKYLIPFICICCACAAFHVSAVYAATEETHDTFAQPGLPGMCRGVVHIISAPLMIPYGFIYGVTVPFTSDPEMNGATNYIAYSAIQTFAAPLAIAANTGIGVGSCCIELISGFMDVMSLGYYDLPDEKHPEEYDSRPFFIQTLSRLGNGNSMFFTDSPPSKASKPVVEEEEVITDTHVYVFAR